MISSFNFLRYNNLLVPKLKNFHITLWVSDITYIKTENGHNYLAIVTDAYSKQIMGFKLSNHMKTSLCIDALKMAINHRKYPDKKLIHHSDRGFQYCNTRYTRFAESNGMIMSMTEQYDPYENAVAERINRTLKYEYGLKRTIKSSELANKMINQAVYIYNNLRAHLSLELRKPSEVHLNPDLEYKSYRKNKENIKQLSI